MMETNDSFFSAINAAAASAANYFPWRRPQLSGSADLDAPRNQSARRRKRKSSHGVRMSRRSSVKEEEEKNDNDDDDDDDEEEEENPLISPYKLTDQDSNPKRCRADHQFERTATIDPKSAENGAKRDSNEKENSSSRQQDYIHVRARRGQATDSHSLAERVRREKISERMKLLQNLVPGCSKVMGKALMLDEIINYVQSLQRQVEHLSMKLAAVNPLDFCANSRLLRRPKDMDNRAPQQQQQQQQQQAPAQIYRAEDSSAGSSYSQRINGTPLESFENKFVFDELDPSFCSSMSMEFPTLNGFADASQLGNFWEGDDLQSVVQMGFFGQGRDVQANLLAELLRPCGDDRRQQED